MRCLYDRRYVRNLLCKKHRDPLLKINFLCLVCKTAFKYVICRVYKIKSLDATTHGYCAQEEQGCHGPWKSWKVLELGEKFPGPGKSLNLGHGPWKSWNRQKSFFFISKNNKNMLLVKIFLIRQRCKTKTTTSQGLIFV